MSMTGSRRRVATPLVRLVVLVCLALLQIQPVPAQSETGTLGGRIVDEQGTPLPGATVRVAGPGEPQTAFTDQNGEFRIEDLEPGQYTGTMELDGFLPVRLEDVDVRAGVDETLDDIRLSLAPGEESIVTAESPIVDTSASDSLYSITIGVSRTSGFDEAEKRVDASKPTGAGLVSMDSSDSSASGGSIGVGTEQYKGLPVLGADIGLDLLANFTWELMGETSASTEVTDPTGGLFLIDGNGQLGDVVQERRTIDGWGFSLEGYALIRVSERVRAGPMLGLEYWSVDIDTRSSIVRNGQIVDSLAGSEDESDTALRVGAVVDVGLTPGNCDTVRFGVNVSTPFGDTVTRASVQYVRFFGAPAVTDSNAFATCP